MAIGESKTESERWEMRCITLCVTALAALAALAAKGAPDMPMLNWMGRENAVKATKDVVMKILRENRELSYGGFSTQRRRGAEKESVITGALPQTPKNSETSSQDTSATLR